MVISQCSVARIGSPDLNPSDLALLFMRKAVKSYPQQTLNQFRLVNYVILTLHETWKYTGVPKKMSSTCLQVAGANCLFPEISKLCTLSIWGFIEDDPGCCHLISIAASKVLPPPKEIGSLPEAMMFEKIREGEMNGDVRMLFQYELM